MAWGISVANLIAFDCLPNGRRNGLQQVSAHLSSHRCLPSEHCTCLHLSAICCHQTFSWSLWSSSACSLFYPQFAIYLSFVSPFRQCIGQLIGNAWPFYANVISGSSSAHSTWPVWLLFSRVTHTLPVICMRPWWCALLCACSFCIDLCEKRK